ncbi:glycosyltransferase family 2 protein [Labrys okinawensis]|nr:glycosyltransferase family 2 protein [Labrys okinawensis]
MFAPLMKGHKGLARVGASQWSVCEADPHFVFKLGPWPARYIAIEVISSGPELEPHLYIDTGHGFRPEQVLPLPPARHGVYAFGTGRIRGFRRVRFDPCEDYPGPEAEPDSFTLNIRAARSLASLRRQLGAAADHLHLLELDELAKAPPPPRQLPPEEHFQAVLNLAEAGLADMAPHDEGQPAPLLSFVVPLRDTPPAFLDALLNSLRSQRAGNWELVLCDDASSNRATLARLERMEGQPRIQVLRTPHNLGIAGATNLGLAAARGDWVGLIDHDDALAPLALDYLNDTIRRHPEAQFIYTDETITDARLKPIGYFFKPAYDPVLLSGVNYVNHLSLYRRQRLQALGGLSAGFDGSQDYELLLRYLSELPRHAIIHLPYPAYLWRRHRASYSATFTATAVGHARRALAAHYASNGVAAPVGPALVPDLHRVEFSPDRRQWPCVSIVIPNRDSPALIARLLTDLYERTDYADFEVIVVDNGSTDARTLSLYETMRGQHRNFRTVITPEPFNFSRQVNRGMREANGQAILLLNNDIEVIAADWLKEMVSCLDYPETGIVGARLLYPSGRLQHAGVIVGLGGLAGHWYANAAQDSSGPMNRLKVRQTLSAVTGACMLISRQCYAQVGEFDETAFAIAYNDIDYCLRAAAVGQRTVWTPFATLTHHESATRGSDETKANKERFQREKEALRQKYHTDTFEDPAYSPWYSRHLAAPREILPPILPLSRSWATPPPVSGEADTSPPSRGRPGMIVTGHHSRKARPPA